MPEAPKGVTPKCPICGKPAAPATQPFCSPRCVNVDLHRWLGGHYRIETDEAPPPGGIREEKDDD
jgi:endogenous inhibitor of DNA gyrase (YacG/DUF329 family)